MINLSKIKAILFSLVLMFTYTSIHAQTGEIRGRVIDEKGNGLKGVTVSALDSNGRSIDKFTYTDSSGNYDLKKLSKEQHNFKFYKEGFSAYIVNKVPFKTDTIITQNVKLKVQLRNTDNVVYSTSSPRFSISQSGEIRGKITNKKKEPLNGVTIAIVDSMGKDRNHFTKSNNDGTYSLKHFFPGMYYVKYYGDGLQPDIINVSVKPDTFTMENIRMKPAKKNSQSYP